ncbi:alkaline phosphatase PhoX [Cyanobium sp. ATX 6A2]|uniref:alkaline phosphatase PhoX n=1 Tax=Cyanobium sp. ATX 6A2 TaxID=2823700 RepID=UPI0020CC38A7|nr:alkaline phosphatase PhoX [Cyanobium sp. ATX 6A2]
MDGHGPLRGSSLDVFGNNACWLFPASGPRAGEALLFATGPVECELCGPCFDREESTLFLAVQHPGEIHGTRQRGGEEMQAHSLEDSAGGRFEQLRQVPLGSNWPSAVPEGHPGRGWWRSAAATAGRCCDRCSDVTAGSATAHPCPSPAKTGWGRAN